MVARQIIWWEKNRLLFNLAILLSGIVMIMLANQVKHISIYYNFNHKFSFNSFYFGVIVLYVICSNFMYTLVYAYLIIVLKKLETDVDRRKSIELFTRRFVLIAGVILTVGLGVIEMIYRSQH